LVKERIRLVHWDAAEGGRCAEAVRAFGYRVEGGPLDPAELRALTRDPPDAFVVDLSRLPSQGRDVAVFFRRSRGGRTVPIVFVGGEPAKVERVRAVLPDASFSDWDGIASALEQALQRPPRDPVVPESALAGYSGAPTPRKLGIDRATRVRVLGAPADLEELIGPLAAGTTVGPRTARPDLVLCFVRSKSELRRLWPQAARFEAPLWIFWTKRSAAAASDVDQRVVREHGLERGWVDHKIARLDGTWAGLRFVRRGRGRAARPA
jgi:hypothetical protein